MDNVVQRRFPLALRAAGLVLIGIGSVRVISAIVTFLLFGAAALWGGSIGDPDDAFTWLRRTYSAWLDPYVIAVTMSAPVLSVGFGLYLLVRQESGTGRSTVEGLER